MKSPLQSIRSPFVTLPATSQVDPPSGIGSLRLQVSGGSPLVSRLRKVKGSKITEGWQTANGWFMMVNVCLFYVILICYIIF